MVSTEDFVFENFMVSFFSDSELEERTDVFRAVSLIGRTVFDVNKGEAGSRGKPGECTLLFSGTTAVG